MIPGLRTQAKVIVAVLLRETRTRFGAYQLGYLWAFAEPLIWVAMFGGLRFLAGREAPAGMDTVSFITTGVVPYMLFQRTASRAVKAIESNKGLLFYPLVRPLDLIIARSMLEIATLLVVFVVLLGANGFWRESFAIDSAFQTWCGLMLAGALGASLGLVLCSLSAFSQTVERLHGPLMRPLFWTSGLFFTANDLPSALREVFLFNPALHVVEIVRDGWFASYTARYASANYVIAWILGLTFLGLSLERPARRRLQLT